LFLRYFFLFLSSVFLCLFLQWPSSLPRHGLLTVKWQL
jgi:hypothetical protein